MSTEDSRPGESKPLPSLTMEFMLTDGERQLTTERQLKYQGTAKVDLDQISLQPLSSREIDHGNVERLREIFAKDGCRRLDLRNHVTAVVSRQHLERACHATGLTLEQLKSRQQQYPRLSFCGRQVECLHGQHRLKAAEDFLFPSDRWWTVDLYLDDISPDLRNALVDEYANEKPPTDGEVYRKIRQYQHESNALFQNRWWSRLSPNKAKRLRRLTAPDNTYLCAAFDALLAIPGLWNGMSLGSLNTVMALKCDEEVIHYLRHVKHFWATLVHHDRAQMARIDLHTVDTLQLYAPQASSVDGKIVKGKVLSGEVFSNFSRSERVAIWERLRSHEMCEGIIPSLHTFFRDVLYLEVCANAVKRLVALNKHLPTIRLALVHSFRPGPADTDCLIQTSETTFHRQPGPNDARLSLAYRQIWLYAMRHYPDMAKSIRSDQAANPARAKARAKADESVIHNMATLARKVGFRTAQIQGILQQSPDRQIARAALLQARKPDHYHYDRETFESLIDQVAGCFALAIPNEGPPTALNAGRAKKLKDRCGIPPEHAQPLDRPHLFLDQLHSVVTTQRNLSSLEVRRSVYYAFFGKTFSQTSMSYTPPAWSSANEPSSPLFVPRDDTPAEREPFAENMSIISLSGSSPIRHQDRSEAREEQLEGRQDPWQGPQPSRQPAAIDSSSPERSAGRQSLLPAGEPTNHWDSSNAEDRPATSGRREGGAGEDDCTEIDENELLHRGEGEDSRARDLPTVETPISGAPVERRVSEGLEERPVGDDTGSSVPAQASSPLQPSRTSRSPPRIRRPRNGNRDAIWKPYDPAQGGNRRAARKVSPDKDRVTIGNSTDPGPSAERWPGPEPLQPIGEHAGLEQPAEEPHALNEDGTATGGPQRDAAGNDARHLAQMEQPGQRSREGDERVSSQIPPSDRAEGISGAQVTPGRESIADPVEQLVQEERAAQEPADTPARLEASPAHAVARRVTEIPADVPSLIAQLREGSQLDAGVRKPKKNQMTLREINRAGTRDAAIADELWGSDCDWDGDEAGGIAAETTAVSPQDAAQYPAVLPDPEQAQREAIARQEGEGLLFDTPHDARDVVRDEANDPAPLAADSINRGPAGGLSPEGRVTITFRAHQRGEWMVTDAVSVDADNPVEAQAIADRYARDPEQEAHFYDCSLRKVAADKCVRAAIDDGSFTVLVSLGSGLAVTGSVVASVTQLLENAGAAPASEDEEEL